MYFKYSLLNDKSVAIRRVNVTASYEFGIIKYIHETYGNIIVYNFSDRHIDEISYVIFSERNDDEAIKLLLNDKKSKILLRKAMKKRRKRLKKNYKLKASKLKAYRSSSYLIQYLDRFDRADGRCSRRLLRVLKRYFDIYTLYDFIHTPISLIKLKQIRSVGIRTVELYTKAYYTATKRLDNKND